MTDVMLVLPLLTTPDFDTYALDALSAPIGDQLWQWGGLVRVGRGFGAGKRSELTGYVALGASTTAYELGDRRFDGTGWTAALEVGPRWTWGSGAARGWADVAGGLHLRVGLPDWSDGAWTVGVGGHGGVGVDFGNAAMRPRIGLESSMTIAPTSYTGTVLLPKGTLSWSWNASNIRAGVVMGLVDLL